MSAYDLCCCVQIRLSQANLLTLHAILDNCHHINKIQDLLFINLFNCGFYMDEQRRL